jgi:hypothetical protein
MTTDRFITVYLTAYIMNIFCVKLFTHRFSKLNCLLISTGGDYYCILWGSDGGIQQLGL